MTSSNGLIIKTDKQSYNLADDKRIAFTLANGGSSTFEFGREFMLQKKHAGKWEFIGEFTIDSTLFKDPITTGEYAGEYRLVKNVYAEEGTETITLAASFSIME